MVEVGSAASISLLTCSTISFTHDFFTHAIFSWTDPHTLRSCFLARSVLLHGFPSILASPTNLNPSSYLTPQIWLYHLDQYQTNHEDLASLDIIWYNLGLVNSSFWSKQHYLFHSYSNRCSF